MARRKPKTGETYTLKEPLGTDPYAIASGTKVTVREVVPADTPGAHDNSEDAVVVETTEGRAWSVGLDTFANDYTKED